MIVLDVETTGTDPHKNSLVSIGAIDFHHPEIRFYEECRIFPGAHVEDAALLINGFTKGQITDVRKKPEADIVRMFLEWLEQREDMVIAGQNVFFDVSFIVAAAGRGGMTAPLSNRIVDQHSITFAHMLSRGIQPPIVNKKTGLNSDAIMEYVGIEPEPKPHIAINGAVWEAEALSRLLHNKPLLDQFKANPIPWVSVG